MIGSFRTEKGMEWVSNVVSQGSSYRISRFLVKGPGLGAHPLFHFEVDEMSGFEQVSIPWVDRVFNLHCPSDIPRMHRKITGFIGVLAGTTMLFGFNYSLYLVCL